MNCTSNSKHLSPSNEIKSNEVTEIEKLKHTIQTMRSEMAVLFRENSELRQQNYKIVRVKMAGHCFCLLNVDRYF